MGKARRARVLVDAARLQIQGIDGMRYLGADPTKPADDLERRVMILLNNTIVAEHEKASRANR